MKLNCAILAGELGVLVFDSLEQRLGIDVADLGRERRALCRACLDWSMRRHHLAGALGAAVLNRCLDSGWARRIKGSRVVSFSAGGERALRERFNLPAR